MAKAKAIAEVKESKKARGKADLQKNNASTKVKEAKPKDVLGQKALRERERKKQQQRRKRYVATLAALLFGLIAYTQRVDVVIASYLHTAWLDATKAAGFTFEELAVEGRHLTPAEDLVDAVGLGIGDSIFAQSLDDIHKRLLNLDMVKEAHVGRDFSGRIIVQLKERKPFALWQYRDRLRVIDAEGIALLRANPDDYPQLVTVVGENAPAHMNELTSFLNAEKSLNDEVVAVVYVSNRRWDVHFVSGVQIMLPEDNPKGAWQKLAKMHKKHGILEQKLQAIDLRLDDKIYITLPDEEQIEATAEGEAI
jgi:cell division protein FtsQ